MIYFMICHSQSLIHTESIVRACPILFSAKLHGLLQEYSFRNRLPALTHQWWASRAPRLLSLKYAYVKYVYLSRIPRGVDRYTTWQVWAPTRLSSPGGLGASIFLVLWCQCPMGTKPAGWNLLPASLLPALSPGGWILLFFSSSQIILRTTWLCIYYSHCPHSKASLCPRPLDQVLFVHKLDWICPLLLVLVFHG